MHAIEPIRARTIHHVSFIRLFLTATFVLVYQKQKVFSFTVVANDVNPIIGAASTNAPELPSLKCLVNAKSNEGRFQMFVAQFAKTLQYPSNSQIIVHRAK